MEDKITIIEGPTPVFEDINDGWAIGLNDSPILYDTIFTQVRTYNGPALVERCHRAWKKQASIYLHYKNEDGLEEEAPIVAARSVTSDEGQVLLLWLRQLPTYDDIKGLAEGFNEEEYEEDDEDFDDEEDFDEDGDDEDGKDLGYLN
ncbi:MAG: hypothetical protein Q8N39_07940 [Pelolinea sp.]|nr:hypothetical protein [Pelolinea sp.]